MSILEGKRALVTGAASGIGRATARKMADEGAAVAIADIDLDGARAVEEEIGAEGGAALAVAVDVSDTSQVEQAVEEAVRRLGGLDILCNNAADLSLLADDGDLLSTDIGIWDRTWAADLRSVMAMSKYALPHLLKAGNAAIVNVSSVDGLSGDNTRFAYATAKAGINILTECMATAYGKRGVRCMPCCRAWSCRRRRRKTWKRRHG